MTSLPHSSRRHRDGFPIVIYNRCLHVLQENQRVLDGAEYLELNRVEKGE